MRGRAAVLTTRLPWPLDDGGRIALWQTVWSAAQEFETTVLCLVPRGTERDPLPAVFDELGVTVLRIPHEPPPFPVAAWRGLFGRWPYTLGRFRNPMFADAVRGLATKAPPGFFLANNLHLATYWDSMAGVPMILREQNLEYVWMKRYSDGLPPGPKRWYAAIQANRLRRVEVELCRRAALVLAITDHEARALRDIAPGAPVATLPVGIDCSLYGPPAPVDPPVILLAGAFDWPPNADGALRFVQEAWPAVRREAPDARLRIAGRHPPAALREAASAAGAEVTGYVDDMKAEFRRATALVIPLWVGAGARVKLIEAMASGLPVVSTSLGAEGLGLERDADYLEGNTPGELAAAAGALLRRPDLRQRLASCGPALAAERWSIAAVARLQNDLCAQVAGARAGR